MVVLLVPVTLVLVQLSAEAVLGLPVLTGEWRRLRRGHAGGGVAWGVGDRRW